MTPAQLIALKSEIAGDPLGLGYAAHLPASPGLVVDLLNAATQSMLGPLRSTTAKAWAAAGPYAAIVDASTNVTHPCRASCLVIRDSFACGDPIHVEDPELQGMLNAWVTAKICTQAQVDTLYARAMQPASRAQVLGWPTIEIRDLVAAGVI
jgi:hypothetical protein